MQGLEYYRFLAGTLPPTALGQAAFRRARRSVQRRMRELAPRAPLSQNQLLNALGVARLEDLAARFREHPIGRGPVEPYERAMVRALVQEHLPWLPNKVCEVADMVLEGELFLFGAFREHSRGELEPGVAALDWLRDPLHGGRAYAGSSAEIDVLAAGVDMRAAWEAARLAHVLQLAQAQVLTGLEGTQDSRGAREPDCYARAAVLHLRDFMATQPLGTGPHWTCAMEAGLRLIHISWALSLLRDSPALGPSFWAEALLWMWQHVAFIQDELEDTQAVSANHLLADLAGLGVVGCFFPELPGALLWRRRALERFSRELLRQSTEDGFSFESSTAYHRFVVELGLVLQAAASRQGLSLSAPALERLWLMSQVAESMVLPHGLMPQVGDNDDSRACVFHLRPALDASHLASVRVALGGPLAQGCSLEPEALWLGGSAGFRRAWQACRNGRKVRELEVAGGLAVLRGSLGRGVSLWAGSNGQLGLGGHAHNDKLACELVLGNRQIVVDPGSPVYSHAPQERDRYRSTAAHPTVQLDGEEQSPIYPGRPFLLPETAKARLAFAEIGRVRAEHFAYQRLEKDAGKTRMGDGVLHRREVLLPAASRSILIVDTLLGEKSHVVELRWPLAFTELVERELSAREREQIELPTEFQGGVEVDTTRAFVLGGAENPVALLLFACSLPWEAEVKEMCWSPGYGQRQWGKCVQLRLCAQLPIQLLSVFVALDEDVSGRVFQSDLESDLKSDLQSGLQADLKPVLH